jgi:hypothetical protein
MAMGGVGEAMLLGAAMGGGSAALTGGDPLKGALLGGLTGGIGGGISTALGSAGTAAGTIPAITEAGVAAANIAPTLATTATSPLTASTLGLTPSPTLLNSAMPYSAGTNFLEVPGVTNLGSTSFGSSLGQLSTGTGGIANIPTNLPIAAPATFAAPAVSAAPPSTFMEGVAKFAKDPMASLMENKFTAAGSALAGATAGRKKEEEEEKYSGPLSRFKFNPDSYRPSFFAAEGGIASLAEGGYDRMVGEEPMYMSNMASGGISNLGSYSDGGRMLKGPGDGMSDSIPASISGKRPARLADGEFVVPADVVSHLGNGSTDAGAKQLYAMMNKVRQARTGRKSQGREIDPRKYTPAYA